MTLHEAMEKLLEENGGEMHRTEIATRLNENGWYKKEDGSPIEPNQIDARVRKYEALFTINNGIVKLKK